jgi:hypothetical protein
MTFTARVLGTCDFGSISVSAMVMLWFLVDITVSLVEKPLVLWDY